MNAPRKLVDRIVFLALTIAAIANGVALAAALMRLWPFAFVAALVAGAVAIAALLLNLENVR